MNDFKQLCSYLILGMNILGSESHIFLQMNNQAFKYVIIVLFFFSFIFKKEL